MGGVSTTDPIPSQWADFARLCLIRSGSRIIPFEPYKYQIALSNALDRHGYVLVAKTRQLGITETIACKFLHWAALDPGFVGVVLSKSQADASNIAKRVRRMVLGMPDRIRLKTQNLTDIELENGGRLIFRPSNPNSTRGLESVGAVLIDECAFIDKIEDIYTAVVPTLEMSENPKIALVSTPNGASGFFWERLNAGNQNRDFTEVCQRVKSGELEPYQEWVDENGWVKSIVHWRGHPIYSARENYLENIAKQKQLSLSAVKQEYDLAFTESQTNVFSPQLVTEATVKGLDKIEVSRRANCYMGIDPSFGGEDYCVAIVLKETSHRSFLVVDLYRENRHSIDRNIKKIRDLIAKYRPECIGVEVNSGGRIYSEQLSDTFYYLKIEEINTTESLKRLAIDRILLNLEQKRLKFPSSSPLKEELLVFRRDGRKMSAPPGKHDDCVMALAMALTVAAANEAGYSLLGT